MPRKPAAAAVTPVDPGTNYPTIKGAKVVATVEEFKRLNAQKKVMDGKLSAARAVLLEAMGDAPVAYIGTRVVQVNEVREIVTIPERPVTKDMVGQMLPAIPGRKGYKLLNVR